jgi:flagellar biosynthesis/type III secretory pathway ATPase
MTTFERGGTGTLPAKRHVRTYLTGPEGNVSPLLRHLVEAAEVAPRFQATGEVVRVIGTTVEAAGLILQLGSICWIDLEPEGMVSAEVVGFKDGLITLVPFGDLSGVRPGSAVRLREQQFRVPIGPALLGRVLDGFGRPLDGMGPLRAEYKVITGTAPHPLGRARISTPISTGVRALDGLLSAGKGQRLGIFAGSGVGKSTLLAMIARHASSRSSSTSSSAPKVWPAPWSSLPHQISRPSCASRRPKSPRPLPSPSAMKARMSYS